jgi:Zn-dependent M28 family amino/carboxypeptidase
MASAPVKIVAVLLCAIALFADSVRIEYGAVQPQLIQQRLEMVSRKVAERRATLESLFAHVGCGGDNLTNQGVPGSKEPNVICAMQGESAATIVVGGHYDFIDRGQGAIDDWSGVALLPSLYQSLASQPRRHRFVFIGFAGEEVGLLGSTQYVKKLSPEERSEVRAMVNLECLGLDAPKVWASRADKELLGDYVQALTAIHMQSLVSNVDRVGDDDSHPFLNARIPVLTIHSITSSNFAFLHTQRDNLKAIRAADYYDSYRVAATFLAYLDTKLE